MRCSIPSFQHASLLVLHPESGKSARANSLKLVPSKTLCFACSSSFPEPRVGNASIQLAFRHLFSALVVDYQLIDQEHTHSAIAVAAYHMG